MPRNLRIGALVVTLCFFAWVAARWLSDRESVGWPAIIVFGVNPSSVAVIKTAVSGYVSDRARRSAQK